MKVPDFLSIVKASRVSWMKRLMAPTNSKWKCILRELILPLSIEHLFQSNLPDEYISKIPIPFYRQVLESWKEIRLPSSQPYDYANEILWNNMSIQAPIGKIKGKKKETIFYTQLYKAGIVRLKDMFDGNGCFLSYNALIARYNVKIDVIKYHRLVRAIPTNMKENVAIFLIGNMRVPPGVKDVIYPVSCREYTTDVCRTSTKYIYNCFIKT